MDIKEIAVITVPYITTDVHFNLAKKTYASLQSQGGFTKEQLIAVINRVRDSKDKAFVESLNGTVIENDKNILSRAWNIGVRKAKELGFKYALIPNLDILLHKNTISELLKYGSAYIDQAGVISPSAINDLVQFDIIPDKVDKVTMPMANNDQSFSCFLLDINAFEKVGDFDEQFEPAYFEDDDYLYRLKQSGYRPTKLGYAFFWHFLQGTIRNADHGTVMVYNESLEKNRERYILKHGGAPKHEQN